MALESLRPLLTPGALARGVYLRRPSLARSLRRAAHLTQQQLSSLTQVPSVTISMFENGVRVPSEQTSLKLLRRLVRETIEMDDLSLLTFAEREILYELRTWLLDEDKAA